MMSFLGAWQLLRHSNVTNKGHRAATLSLQALSQLCFHVQHPLRHSAVALGQTVVMADGSSRQDLPPDQVLINEI